MLRLNKYNLESVCDKNGRLFSFLESLSLILKIAALLLLLLLFRYFYVAIAVWVLSIVVGFFKRNLIYKYVYSVDGEHLTVKKAYNEERVLIVEEVDLKGDFSLTVGESEKKYYEKSTGTVVTVCKQGGEPFSIAVDDYFYAVLDYAQRRESV